MRFVVIALLLGGCFGTSVEQSLSDDGDDTIDPAGQEPGSCFVDQDCQLVGATCCECPTFATSLGDPKYATCDAVECDTSVCPTNVEARCDEMQTCQIACAQLECITCPVGYIREDNGCLSCTCSEPPPQSQVNACTFDSDCVRVRNDCCGCANGGEDTAVTTDSAAAFDQSLNCSAAPSCPGVMNQGCDPGAQARCVQGSCALVSEPFPADACGRPDLPDCPSGTVCRINVNDSASLYGVGVCRP
jgi:hypothetical protein